MIILCNILHCTYSNPWLGVCIYMNIYCKSIVNECLQTSSISRKLLWLVDLCAFFCLSEMLESGNLLTFTGFANSSGYDTFLLDEERWRLLVGAEDHIFSFDLVNINRDLKQVTFTYNTPRVRCINIAAKLRLCLDNESHWLAVFRNNQFYLPDYNYTNLPFYVMTWRRHYQSFYFLLLLSCQHIMLRPLVSVFVRKKY